MTNTIRHGDHATRDANEPDGLLSTERNPTTAELAALVATLEATGDYRVLQRLVPLPLLRGQSRPGLRCAIILDTETTGLVLPGSKGDMPPSEVVSIGMVAVAYDPADGDIKGAIGRFHKLREPSHPIPEAATKIHGITNEDVRGCTITAIEIAEWIALTTAAVQDNVQFGSRDEEKLPLIAAHHAAFDRPMVEALFPDIFPQLPWACSHTQVPWADHGYEGTKLCYLAMHAGLFYGSRHSALADADAVVELLRQCLGERSALSLLRDAARQDTYRIYVTTPYDPKTIADFKARGYRWSPGESGCPRAWYWEGAEGLDAELGFLDAEGFRRIEVKSIDAFDRFSWRS